MTNNVAAGHKICGLSYRCIRPDIRFGFIEDDIRSTAQVKGGVRPELVANKGVRSFTVAVGACCCVSHTGKVPLVKVGSRLVGPTVGIVRIAECVAATVALIAGSDGKC